MKQRKKKNKIIFLVIIVALCFLYLQANSTYTSYESEVTGNVESEIADWKIRVNDTLITTDNTEGINIDSIEWETNHTREGKASPGTSGVITITIDPTTTNVAFDYELTIIDQTVDANKILTVTSIENTLTPLEKDENIYHGTMSLDDIKAGEKETLTINVKWEDNGIDTVVVPGEEPTGNDFIEIDFKAIQKQ